MSMTSSLPPLTNRQRLVAHARALFAERGFEGVSVDEIAAAAGLTKGAVYYQFKDKTDLFRAACEAVLADVRDRVETASMGHSAHHLDEIVIGGDRLYDAYDAPDARRLLLVDGLTVLGVDGWIALQEPVGVGLIAHALSHLADERLIEPDVVPALAHLLFGAFVQGALRIAASSDPQAAGVEVRRATRTLTQALLSGAGAPLKETQWLPLP
ncbi:TetR/AcrR family transcriptional regulator [Caulobacter vibrioides]|uniref:TetR/AcrR family transcriptional regulator n=1 Tax=Caulobacter vibrioides TaxID=155892 RepID=UPI000BB4CD70|nr:TetR/AcrR family transcriptional regulator [Caulobacter vibrioides]ATC25809.1 TetR/AcrR family transcriptional regulator [Caulobacter vibrioides]PLR13594.1 TetR/AcrR family transcriptional regulator [Caulobacter vibrioides]